MSPPRVSFRVFKDAASLKLIAADDLIRATHPFRVFKDAASLKLLAAPPVVLPLAAFRVFKDAASLKLGEFTGWAIERMQPSASSKTRLH